MGLLEHSRVAVGLVEVDLYLGLPRPSSIVLKNIGVTTAYLGGTGVLVADGYPLDPGEIWTDKCQSSEELFAIAAVATEIAIIIDERTV